MNSTLIAPPATRVMAAQSTMMEAIVQDRYGSPDVLDLRQVDRCGGTRSSRYPGQGHAQGRIVITV